jgi:hypothetical protein
MALIACIVFVISLFSKYLGPPHIRAPSPVLVVFQQNAGAMNLFITDLRLLRCSGVSGGDCPALPPAMIEAAMAGGLVDGMPFILDDDGAYDINLNRFFRACPTMGVRSMHSLHRGREHR